MAGVAVSEAKNDTGQDWKIGVDIGGTFIDFCALETRSGRAASLKVLTTPNDPCAEVKTGLLLLAEREGLDPAAISRFVHGTTVGVDTIIQTRGAPLALLTNAGFEDVIELARLRMAYVYSLFCTRPEQLISRDMIFGIPVRLRADGNETRAPDLAEVAAAVPAAKARGVRHHRLLPAFLGERDPGSGGQAGDRAACARTLRLFLLEGLAGHSRI